MARNDAATRTLRRIAMRHAGAEETIACQGTALDESQGESRELAAQEPERPIAAKKARGVRK